MEIQRTTMLRVDDVVQRTGLSKSQILRMVTASAFPKPIKLSQRAVAWIDEEIETWLRERIGSSRAVT